jgi:hypothetical protein
MYTWIAYKIAQKRQKKKREGIVMENNKLPGQSQATVSLVLGIIAVVCWFFGYSAIISVICGIIGLVCASNSKKAGYASGVLTAGFVLSIIGLVGGAIVFIACVACAGVIGASGILN